MNPFQMPNEDNVAFHIVANFIVHGKHESVGLDIEGAIFVIGHEKDAVVPRLCDRVEDVGDKDFAIGSNETVLVAVAPSGQIETGEGVLEE